MFTSNKTFKYEVEVNAIVRELTSGLNQRIFALEMQNNQLNNEVQMLKQGICLDLQRLEKRITDFTDIWHPIMMENINRIKSDLEETVKLTERENYVVLENKLIEKTTTNVQKLNDEMEVNFNNKILQITNYVKQLNDEMQINFDSKFLKNTNTLQNNVLIGFQDVHCITPIFINKNVTADEYLFICKNYCKTIILESLIFLQNSYYDPAVFYGNKVIFNDGKTLRTIRSTKPCLREPDENIINDPEVKNIYSLCKKMGIKFTYLLENQVNGVPLKILFNDM